MSRAMIPNRINEIRCRIIDIMENGAAKIGTSGNEGVGLKNENGRARDPFGARGFILGVAPAPGIVSLVRMCLGHQKILGRRGCPECRRLSRRPPTPEQRARAKERARRRYFKIISDPERYSRVAGQQRAWRMKNRERVRTLQKKWRTENKDRWLEMKRGRSKKKRVKLFEHLWAIQAGLCVYCRCELSRGGPDKAHLDHILPISRGGGNGRDNLQLLCPSCNIRKSDKLPDVFAKEIGSPAHSFRSGAVEIFSG